ncbi:FtsW/RodA/SpoVE family cell cycle protein [Brachyspira pilosicoli]|uniref:Cell wall polymerase n=3 Tax=Brachyspira pilosicoli TaxID=52584 RepID=D8IF06_BRAP9|nr:FtsW/RodA/SpoVE family cell cycle protein [Brachyspira pilosicoli]ADK31729.1 rod shape-determining protein, RodA [Brachyspira pilosicoli 95/1000]MBW5378468.1 rod shape-determining protein RodA [Brachyspira pilosicoli]MBW5391687.1 rod shape-determining protein RodA [Brachyspira pilosicoli]MBW5398598.1 rod shape-determining protein RodA [Brachyspira pilosicoli]WIH80328.1 rod shape-determining protein RodA [Brachyspira pilosicoli]
MNEKKELKRLFVFDWRILISILFLMVAGAIAVYSSTYSPDSGKTSWIFLKYIFFSVVGLVIMCITMFINYTKLAEHRMSLYIPMLVVLILVLIPGVGTTINGSSSWLFGMQPSEFGKIVMIIFLAGYLDQIGDKIKQEKYFLIAGIFISIPIGLVLMQPDLGTVLVYCFIVFVMLFVGGVPLRYIISLLSIGVIGLSIPMFLEYKRMSDDINNILFNFLSQRLYIGYIAGGFLFISILLLTINFYMNNKYVELFSFTFFVLFLSMCAALTFDIGLKTYQKERLLVFMNPELTRLSSGYNIIQSLIAVGSGGLFGEGFLNGSQSQLNFIPQQVNDFIFSNICEEWGFIGSALVVLAYATIFVRGITVAYFAKDRLGALIISGVVAMFLCHVLINIGMVVGMMPITGLTLPFVSSGGSSILTFSISIGLIFNVEARRYVH